MLFICRIQGFKAHVHNKGFPWDSPNYFCYSRLNRKYFLKNITVKGKCSDSYRKYDKFIFGSSLNEQIIPIQSKIQVKFVNNEIHIINNTLINEKWKKLTSIDALILMCHRRDQKNNYQLNVKQNKEVE